MRISALVLVLGLLWWDTTAWVAYGLSRWCCGREPACQCRRQQETRFHPWVEKTPEKGNGNPPQYSSLESPIDRGAWWAAVHGVPKSWIWLSNLAHMWGWLIKSRNTCLTFLEAGRPSSSPWLGWCLVRACFLVPRWPSSLWVGELPGSQMAVFSLGGRASWFTDGRLLPGWESFLVPRWPSSPWVGHLPGSQMAVFSLGGTPSWFPGGRLLSESESFLVPRWPSSLSVGELPGSQMAISLNAHRVEEALWGLFESAKWKWSCSISCPTLCDPMNCSLPGSSFHGILQARVLKWVSISFSRGSSQLRDRIQVSRFPGRCFNLWATREAASLFRRALIPFWGLHLNDLITS